MDDICFICSTEQKSWSVLLCYFSKMRFIDCLRSHEMVSLAWQFCRNLFFNKMVVLYFPILMLDG